ncbi:OLC1v1012851C1 [Oldenlandia corymbosa var. corymbosa]|uniref:OLC1v1012851C1 n=1 Tax=Oldenlandia corymbosa var. corymbosa TaxID=529605 RepID=A0AAV1DWU8_OLDCO|nr:OLC1v1012851C1 [Oldenlandia corymbosa var. corymbosa]
MVTERHSAESRDAGRWRHTPRRGRQSQIRRTDSIQGSEQVESAPQHWERRMIMERAASFPTDLSSYIVEHHWKRLCDVPQRPNLTAVREFYRSMREAQGDTVTMRGRAVSINEAAIRELLQFPEIDFSHGETLHQIMDFDHEEELSGMLSRELDVIWTFKNGSL